jgi:putative peptidoglycan lipid II flippase
MGIASKAVLVARDLLIANHLGVGDSVDAFMMASMVVLFVSSVLSAALGGAFLPVFVKLRENDGSGATHALLARVTAFATLVALVLAVAMELTAHPIFALLAPGFGEAKRQLTVGLFRVMVPGLLLTGVTLTFASVFNANGRFVTAALGPLLNTVVCVAILALGLRGRGVELLAWASLAGAATEAVVLTFAAVRQGLPVLPAWPLRHPELARVARQSVPLAMASLLSTANVVIDQFMASTLGSGAVSSIGYGRKVVQMMIPLATMTLSTVYFPTLARMVAVGDWTSLRSTARRCVRLTLLASIPATLALMAASKPLVRMLFERGAFGAADTDLVATIQQLYLLQVPFHVGGIVSVRLLNAMGENHRLTRIAVVNLVANVVGNIVFMRLLGVVGIGLSTSVVFLVSFAQVQWTARAAIRRQVTQDSS